MRPFLLMLCALLVGCRFDRSVPPSARITCDADDKCPPGMRCVAAIGQCAVNAESTSPTLDDAHLMPSVGRVGTLVTVRFTASEPLITEPVVAAFFRGAGVAVPFTLQRQEGLTYTFELRVVGTEPEGQATVLVDLTDTSGNRGERLSVGSLVLDFTPAYATPADVLLIPWRGCPRFDFDRLGVGSVAKVAFSVDPGIEAKLEPVDGTGLVITQIDAGQTQRLFEVRLLPSPPQDRDVAFNVRTRDAVGNEQVQPLVLSTPLGIDSVLPPSVERGDGGQWVLWRVPEAVRDGGSGAWLEVSPGALPGGLQVRVEADDGTIREGLSSANTALRVPLPLSVGPTVSVSTVDSACNPSPALKVRDGAMILSTNGSTVHAFETSQLLTDGLFSPRTPSPSRYSVASELLFSRVRAVADRQTSARMLFDDGLGRVLLLGGRDGTNFTDEVQEWDGTGWRVTTSVLPSARDLVAAAFDRKSGQTLMFGGSTSDNTLYALSKSIWTAYPALNQPGSRGNSCMTWDGEKMLLKVAAVLQVPPSVPAPRLLPGQAWTWDGARFTFLDAGAFPSDYPGLSATICAAAYDERRDKTVILDVMPDGGVFTLEWDRARFTLVADAGARSTTHLAYDANLQRVVMAGDPNTADAGLLVFEPGVGWVEGKRLGPCAAGGSFVAFDRVRSELVVHQIASTCVLRSDGGVFTLSPRRPDPRLRPGLAFSEAFGGAVLHGGLTSGGTSLADTWLNANGQWRQLPSGPPAHGAQLVALVDGGVLLASDDRGSTWVMQGTSWARLDAGLPVPDAGHTVALARSDGGVFAYVDAVGAFEFDGRSWRQRGGPVAGLLPDAGLFDLTDLAMTLDADGEPVTFGGHSTPANSAGVACQFDPVDAGFTCQLTSTAALREAAALVRDDVRGATLAIGGWNFTSGISRQPIPFMSYLATDGGVATGLYASEPGDDSPVAPRQQHSAVAAGRPGAWLVFGGAASPTGAPTNDFFLLERGRARPEAVALFRLGAVGLLQPGLTLTDLEYSVHAAQCVDGTDAGCAVDVFEAGRWQPIGIAANRALNTSLHLGARRQLFEIAGTVGVRLHAQGATSGGVSQTGIDQPELIVRYVSAP